MPEYGLSLAFDTDSPEFCRGMEVGMMWRELQDVYRWDDSTFTLHASNAEMVIRIAEALGVQFKADHVDDTWMIVTFYALLGVS